MGWYGVGGVCRGKGYKSEWGGMFGDMMKMCVRTPGGDDGSSERGSSMQCYCLL